MTPINKTMKPELNFNETLIKLSLLLNPIKETFFMNNKLEDDFVWNVPGQENLLKFVDEDNLPLVDY